MLVLTFILVILLDMLVIYLRNSKYYKVSLIITFIFLWIMLGWSYGAYDVEVAISRYENYHAYSSSSELGYSFIIDLAHKIGMNYRSFFIVCSFFELGSMFLFVKNNSKNPLASFVVFLIFPFVIYLQYIRNLAAFSIVLFGFTSIIKKTKHCNIKYLVSVLLASLIHLDSLFFLLYFPMFNMSKNKCIFLLIFVFAFLSSDFSLNVFYKILMSVFGDDKVQQNINTVLAQGQFGRLFAISFHSLEFWVVYLFFIKKRINVSDRYSRIVFRINLGNLLLIPLTKSFGIGFARFFDLISIVNYCYFISKACNLSKNGKRQFASLLCVFLLGLNVLYYRNLEYRNSVIVPFFSENEASRVLVFGIIIISIFFILMCVLDNYRRKESVKKYEFIIGE